MGYKLISFDMDGTLLNSNKQINTSTKQAITKAKKQGKEIIVCTGRGVSELDYILEEIPEIQYVVCLSGALVYDIKNKKEIYRNYLSVDTVKAIYQISKQEDVLLHMLNEGSYIQKDFLDKMGNYHMGVYKDMYKKVCILKEDLEKFYNDNPFEVAKVNLYHTDTDSRNRTIERLKHANLPVSISIAEYSSVEINMKNVHKGQGLIELCKFLNIDTQDIIAVGDSDNDIEAFKVAGLSIGMGNCNQRVKDIVNHIVDDCDHDGCKQAIEDYLLR